MFNFHTHVFGEIKNGFQYCTKCNKAIPVECQHKWKILEVFERSVGWNVKGYVYTLQCTECGSLKKEDHSHYNKYEF